MISGFNIPSRNIMIWGKFKMTQKTIFMFLVLFEIFLMKYSVNLGSEVSNKFFGIFGCFTWFEIFFGCCGGHFWILNHEGPFRFPIRKLWQNSLRSTVRKSLFDIFLSGYTFGETMFDNSNKLSFRILPLCYYNHWKAKIN